jgi:MFS transporter, DHA1 family, multidrug resistance protein
MRQRWNIAILFFCMMVVMLGFGMIIPILPFYIENMGASGQELGILMAIFSMAQFIFSPIWGGLSDRIGRKPVLAIGMLGNAATMVLFGLSNTIGLLFLTRGLSGVLGSATLPVAMAYIGDSTSERNRGGGMGVIGAAMGVGMVLGPGLGGWASGISLQAPFFIGAGLSLLALVLVLLVLPESLPAEGRIRKAEMRAPQLKGIWLALLGPLGFMFFMAFLVNFGLASFEGVFGLFAKDRHGYNPVQVGGILSVIGIVSAVIQGFLTGPATRRLGEQLVIKLSLIASTVGFGLMLAAESYAGVVLTVGFFVFANAMLRPAIQSAISKRTSGGQGAAMGMVNAFMSLGRVAGPLWAGFLFDVNLIYPYLTGAVIMAAGFVLSLVWRDNSLLLQTAHETAD